VDAQPEHLAREAALLTEEIHESFRDVYRMGGVSWAESEVIDMYGMVVGDPIYHDHDRTWHDLVDDPEWHSDPGVGGWAFLDPIGFRYYLPAAMIRGIWTGEAYELPFWLSLRDGFRDYTLEQWSLIDEAQRVAVVRFLIYMAAVARAHDQEEISDEWREVLDGAWAAPLPRPSSSEELPPAKKAPRKKSSPRSPW
jgi:hypothetical protein